MSKFAPRVVSEAKVDWVKFDAVLARDGSVDPVDKALYAALASFMDQGLRESDDDLDADDVPTRKRLAECIGRSVDTVDRSTKRLEGRGLIEVDRRPDPRNPKVNVPSVYRLLDHERWDERAAARAAARQAEREAKAAAREAKKKALPDEGGGRAGAATLGEGVAAPVRPGWPHGYGQGGRTSAAVLSFSQESLSQNTHDPSAHLNLDGSAATEREIPAAPDKHASLPAPRADQAPTVGVDQVLASYRQALRRPLTKSAEVTLRSAASELLADGFPAWWLSDRAREMAPRGWTDLNKHCARSTVPVEDRATSVSASEALPWCEDTDCDHISRLRTMRDENGFHVASPCPACHPSAHKPAVAAG